MLSNYGQYAIIRQDKSKKFLVFASFQTLLTLEIVMENTQPRVLLVAKYYIIEPLGILYLAGLAKSLGYEVAVELVPNNDFSGLYKKVEEWKPDFVGFQIWTGWHLQTFAACDRVREMGSSVIIGGPHVTYFTDQCSEHGDYIVRGDGFRSFERILRGELTFGVHFDPTQLANGFPHPDRTVVYDKYTALRTSSIKSIITSIGCPYTCSYCYAPEWNGMYGGFKHTQRSVDDIVREGVEIRDGAGAELIYFQDDIFGFDQVWLAEFSKRWKEEVGIPFHCQIRLELAHKKGGDRRLDYFVAAGCTGITLAIESGNSFLREYVLHRAMTDELILEGCKKILSRGMTLRLEQILGVPFSTLETDLSTLEINSRIAQLAPSITDVMGWTSILAPYEGTEMGEVSKGFGFYEGNNDDLTETFFDESRLRHTKSGVLEKITPVLREIEDAEKIKPPKERSRKTVLERLHARKVTETVSEVLMLDERDEFSKKHLPGPKPLCDIEFLDAIANRRYVTQVSVLQRLFMWLVFIPQATVLARSYLELSQEEWTWKKLGQVTSDHFRKIGKGGDATQWTEVLVKELGYTTLEELPKEIRENPLYFVFVPSSAEFAREVVALEVIRMDASPGEQFDMLGGVLRRWLFHRSLYKIEAATKSIAT